MTRRIASMRGFRRRRWTLPTRGKMFATTTSVIAATTALATTPASAPAYQHSWSCSRNAGNHCTDYVGSPYNPWHALVLNSPTTVANYCVKGTDSGGGIWGFACVNNTQSVQGMRCNAPYVQAYSYGNGYGGSAQLDDLADTSGGC